MNAKGFFYVSVGIVLLVIAYSIGARTARADFDRSAGPVIGLEGSINVLMRADGTFWQANPTAYPPTGWQQVNWPTPPVPLDQVAHWAGTSLVTADGYFWLLEQPGTLQAVWRRTPQPIPAAAVQAFAKSMSDVKGSYRK